MEERKDDFLQRRKHLASMSDTRLKEYFYELADKMIEPLLVLGYENTSKSIERSILLRMGFSSLQAKDIVNLLDDNDLLKKGAGHCIYAINKDLGIELNRAGDDIIEGKHIDFLKEYFKQ
ncbi:MAG: D-ornithine 4,5-aminomutase subunit OraS [Candidatus Izemoplasma sp.]